MNGFNLRMYFTGLCLFKPERDDKGKVTRARVMMVNTEKGLGNELLDGEAPIERHSSVVQFALKNRWSDEPRYPLLTARDGSLLGLWELKDETVRIVADGVPMNGGLEVDDTPPDDPTRVTSDNRDSFEWLIPLFDKNHKLARFDDAGFARNRKDRIVAEIVLESGTLSPASFHVDESGEHLQLWDFGDEKPRAITTVVVHEVWIPGSTVRLEAKSVDNSRAKRYLTLAPSGKRGEDYVEVWVMNRETEEVTNHRLAPPLIPGRPRGRAHEIRLYHRLVKDRPGASKKNLPKPVLAPGGHAAPGIFKYCSDSTMLPGNFPRPGGELVLSSGCEPVRVES